VSKEGVNRIDNAALRRRTVRPRADQALSRQVYATLRDQILHFVRKPFEPISEQALAEELGVSRTPVREALARLSELGFVDIVPQSGSRIAPLRLADLEKSQFLREALELALLNRALERDDRPALVRRLRTELAIQQAFVEAGDAARFYASDEQFHAAIGEQAGMLTVLPEMARAKTHMDRFRHLMLSGLESLPTILAQHQAIVTAITADDVPGAVAAMQTHLRRILAFEGKARTAHPDFFEESGEIARVRRREARVSARRTRDRETPAP
jgi:DNA-binding GntR family transcriptional regulator